MVMLNGDECGSSGSRRSQIYFKCDPQLNKTEVNEVSEPKTCSYKIVLSSSLVCETQTNSMHVYPHLDERLKSEWDLVYSEFTNGFITEKVKTLKLLDTNTAFI